MKIKTSLIRLITALTKWVYRAKDNITVFLKKYPELITIPAAFVVWVLSVHVLRWFDKTSGIFDAGVFQIPIFAVLQLFVYASIAWLVMGLLFGTFRRYLLTDLKPNFNKLTPWQKIKISYVIFFSLLLSLVALSYTL